MVLDKRRRKTFVLLLRWLIALASASTVPLKWARAKDPKRSKEATMRLRPPNTNGTVSVEQAIQQRRTVRSYAARPLDLGQLSQLLWAAQGVTGSGGVKRAAPSAGALYPMDVYAVVGRGCVAQLEAGVYRYAFDSHTVAPLVRADLRSEVAKASLSQMWMAQAPLNIVISAEYRRITGKYGERGVRYAMIEAGHIAQNLFLQAEALGLKAGIVGAFRDQQLIRALMLPPSHEPLLVMPIGFAV
jgi:SagB-type dehydrogenase family enzyme